MDIVTQNNGNDSTYDSTHDSTNDNLANRPPAVVFHLAAAGSLRPAKGDLPDRVNDLQAFYYWKDAIVVGSYVHPAGRFALDITRDRLDGLVSNFSRMKDNGVGVPILMDHAPTASSTLGWIVDVKRDGDQLLELHQFLGEDARDIGLRNKVSLGIDPAFVDGKGNEYGEAIVHSAVTPVPVVPGQGEFRGIAASGIGVAPMEHSIADHIELTLKRSTPKPPTAKAASPAVVDHVSVDLQGALRMVLEMKRDLALSRGAVTPAVAAELFNLLVESPNVLTLSTTSNSTTLALAVFDTLAKNHAVPLGEITGLQVLSRTVPGDDGSLDDLRQRMIELASGKV